MAVIKSEVEIRTMEDNDGGITTSTVEKTSKIERCGEPDYIKLYTRMWCEFNGIPDRWRNLFFELVCRMSYCNSKNLSHSQIVNTGSPWREDIMAALGWGAGSRSLYQRGLKALCACNAIKHISRGVYQINPQYAGRGEWKYNPRYDRGGIEDLVATFDFREGTVETKMTWASSHEDPAPHPLDLEMRKHMNVRPEQDVTVFGYDYTPPTKPEGSEVL